MPSGKKKLLFDFVPDIQLPPDTRWHEFAACSDVDSEVFFPSREPEKGASYVEAARHCESCPVRRRCLTEAMKMWPDEIYGMWGGFTPRQLRRLRRSLPHAKKKLAMAERNFPHLVVDITDDVIRCALSADERVGPMVGRTYL